MIQTRKSGIYEIKSSLCFFDTEKISVTKLENVSTQLLYKKRVNKVKNHINQNYSTVFQFQETVLIRNPY